MTLESQSNPFRSPDVSVEAVTLDRLTKLQRRALEYYLKHRGEQIGWRDAIRHFLRQWSVSTIVCGILIWLGYQSIPRLFPQDQSLPDFAALGLAALFIGMMLRDATTLQQASEMWPVLQDVLDWDKVSARLKQPA
jgi:hypothetical protein